MPEHPDTLIWVAGTARFRTQIEDLARTKIQPILVVNEASLLRLEVFSELHTITQFECDSKPWLPIILAEQKNLADNLLHRHTASLASRIMSRIHLDAVTKKVMDEYIGHHLTISGIKNSPFEEVVVTAVFQGSGGIFRKANHLARDALIAAASEKSQIIIVEHVRLAANEIF